MDYLMGKALFVGGISLVLIAVIVTQIFVFSGEQEQEKNFCYWQGFSDWHSLGLGHLMACSKIVDGQVITQKFMKVNGEWGYVE